MRLSTKKKILNMALDIPLRNKNSNRFAIIIIHHNSSLWGFRLILTFRNGIMVIHVQSHVTRVYCTATLQLSVNKVNMQEAVTVGGWLPTKQIINEGSQLHVGYMERYVGFCLLHSISSWYGSTCTAPFCCNTMYYFSISNTVLVLL